jgi:hypothetical protein
VRIRGGPPQNRVAQVSTYRAQRDAVIRAIERRVATGKIDKREIRVRLLENAALLIIDVQNAIPGITRGLRRISVHEKIASRSKSWPGGCHVISVPTERD